MTQDKAGPPASGKRASATGDRPPASGEGPSASGKRASATGDRSPASGEGPPASGKRASATGDGPMVSGKGSDSGNRPLASGNEPLGSGNEPLGSGHEPPGSGNAPPASGDEPPASGDPSSGGPVTRRLMSAGGIIASVLFLLVWLGPITYVGSAGRDIGWMPRDLRHMQRVACLFTREVRSWGTYHVEIRPAPGAPWVELPLAGYFDMSIFGYRNRFHRLVGKSYRRPGGAARNRYLAQWIAARRAALEPDAPPLAGMRFVSSFKTVDELRRETGRYCEPTLAEMPPKRRRVLAAFDARALYDAPATKGGR